MIGASIFTLSGDFWSNLSYLFHIFISVVISVVIALPCVWWMVYGWMAWSGLLVLVVKCVCKFSLPGGGFWPPAGTFDTLIVIARRRPQPASKSRQISCQKRW